MVTAIYSWSTFDHCAGCTAKPPRFNRMFKGMGAPDCSAPHTLTRMTFAVAANLPRSRASSFSTFRCMSATFLAALAAFMISSWRSVSFRDWDTPPSSSAPECSHAAE